MGLWAYEMDRALRYVHYGLAFYNVHKCKYMLAAIYFFAVTSRRRAKYIELVAELG
jgi:hypothetical protein